MKKNILAAILIAAVEASAGAQSLKPDWNPDLMVKTCVERVSEQVEKESKAGIAVRFDPLKANAQMAREASFVCLVVGDRQERGGSMMKKERRAYWVAIQPGEKLKTRVAEIPLF